MKLAAIDIGSNGVRLLISRPLEPINPNTSFKKIEFTRLPLRLGDDVFQRKKIGKKKSDLLLKAMKAFRLLIEIYNVEDMKACATSAMRDAKNADEIIKRIFDETEIVLNVISGQEESKLIINSFMHQLKPTLPYIHIDVGGGSTEISLIQNQITIETRSFNIGTVRLREKKVSKNDWNEMNSWVKSVFTDIPQIKAIGTGGNINKLYALSETVMGEFMKLSILKETSNLILPLTQYQRVYDLQMNPDRAEVIDYAAQIYIHIMQLAGANEILAPNKGLKDGILHELWNKQLNLS